MAVLEQYAYRFDYFTSLLSTLLTTTLLYFLWTAIYENSTSMDRPLQNLLTYVCLGQAFSVTRISWAQRVVVYRAAGSIQSGDVLLDLIRPVDYQVMQMAGALGLYVIETLLINIPAYLLALAVFGISLPASPEAALGFVLSLPGAFMLGFSLNYLIAVAAFWMMGTLGLFTVKQALMDILAGSIVPISLFPEWLRRIALALPFQGMAYLPLSIYLGDVRGGEMWLTLLKQYGWAALVLVLTRLLWMRAARQLTVQGG